MASSILDENSQPRVATRGADNPGTRAKALGQLAMRALVEEAKLTPKPGLVDQRGSGAHFDMTLPLMLRSAHCLDPMFAAMARAAADRRPSRELKEELTQLGRTGEARMLTVTGGVNTHRGAIWTLGLLVAAAAMVRGKPEEMAQRAGQLARIRVRGQRSPVSHGIQVARRYGFSGARGEAQDNFPHVIKHGLPALWRSRRRGNTEAHARLDALMAIMARLDDTCLVHRGGLHALSIAQGGASRAILLGGASAPAGHAAILRLHDALLRCSASPGGSADLLAAVLFLDGLDQLDRENYPWKN